MATEVTVCVPAYQAAGFIGETLRSLQAQDFQDFRVKVGVEPADTETLEVCNSFLSDSRFEVVANECVLGWAKNIQSLLNTTDTPYFSILPHDDLYHSSYLATLVRALKQNPDASVAYADSSHFGSVSHIKRLHVVRGPVHERLLSFFLAGAEAVPWRGLANKRLIGNNPEFPDNRFGGFAVECEWALRLLLHGQAAHIEQPLYLKRHFGGKRETISWEWMHKFDAVTILAALEHHREAMKGAHSAIDLPDNARQWVDLAFEVAMLRRHVRFCRGRISFTHKNITRAGRVRQALDSLHGELADKIRSRLDLSCSINAMASKDSNEVEFFARSAVQADKDNWEAQIHLARVLHESGRTAEARSHVLRVKALEPDGEGVRALDGALM